MSQSAVRRSERTLDKNDNLFDETHPVKLSFQHHQMSTSIPDLLPSR